MEVMENEGISFESIPEQVRSGTFERMDEFQSNSGLEKSSESDGRQLDAPESLFLRKRPRYSVSRDLRRLLRERELSDENLDAFLIDNEQMYLMQSRLGHTISDELRESLSKFAINFDQPLIDFMADGEKEYLEEQEQLMERIISDEKMPIANGESRIEREAVSGEDKTVKKSVVAEFEVALDVEENGLFEEAEDNYSSECRLKKPRKVKLTGKTRRRILEKARAARKLLKVLKFFFSSF